MAAKVKALQEWCRRQCEGYRDVTVTNMTSSWKSGLAFCAIIHRYRPDLIDYDSLKKEDVFENNQLAFDTAQELGIPALLDAEDMVAMKVPDKLCIVTYVSQYHNFFRNKPQLGGPGVRRSGSAGIKRTQSTPPVGEPDAKKSSTENLHGRLQNKENIETKKIPSRQGSIGEICHMCNKKVYLMERHIDENRRLYHRKCIRESQRADSLQRNKHLMSSISELYKKDQSQSPTNDKGTFHSSTNRQTTSNVLHNMNTAKPDIRTDISSPICTASPTVQTVKSNYSPQHSPQATSISKDSDSDESRSPSPGKSTNLSKSLYSVSSYKSPVGGSPVKPLAASTPAEHVVRLSSNSPVRPQSVDVKGPHGQTFPSKVLNDIPPTSPNHSKGDDMKKKWLSDEKPSPSKGETKSFEERMSAQKSPSSPVSPSNGFSFTNNENKPTPDKGENSVLSGLLSSLAGVRNRYQGTSSPSASSQPQNISVGSRDHPSSPRSLSPSPPRSILKRGSDEGCNDLGFESSKSVPRPILKNKGESPLDPASPPKTSQPMRSILKTSSETPASSVEAKPALKHSPGSGSTPISPKSVLKTSSESFEEPMSVSPPRSALKPKHEDLDPHPRPILKTGHKDYLSSSSNQPKPILKTKEHGKATGAFTQQGKEPKSILRKSSWDESAEKKSSGWTSWLRSNKSEESLEGTSQSSSPGVRQFNSRSDSGESQSMTNSIQTKTEVMGNKNGIRPAFGKASEAVTSLDKPQWVLEAEKRQAARGGKYEDPEKKHLGRDGERKEIGVSPERSSGVAHLTEFQSTPKTEKFDTSSSAGVREKSGQKREVRIAKIVYVEDEKGSPQPNAASSEKNSKGQASNKAADTKVKNNVARTVADKSDAGKASSQTQTSEKQAPGNKHSNIPEKFPQKQKEYKDFDAERKSGGLSPTKDLDMVSIVQRQLNKGQLKNKTGPKSTVSPKTETGKLSAKPASNASNVVPLKKPAVNGWMSPRGNGLQAQGSSNSDSTKPEWMIEAERRQIARNGVYVDPENGKLNKEKSFDSVDPSTDLLQPKKKIVPDKSFHFNSGESDLESSLEKSSPQAPRKPVRTLPGKGKSPALPAREPLDKKAAISRIQNRPLPLTPGAGPQKRKVNAEARMSPWQIQRALVDLDKQLQIMEARGRELEEKIRSGTDEAMDEDEDLMIKWFELVNKKNDLVRAESELMYRQKQQELEDMHSDVEYDLRCLLEKPEHLKTASDKIREESLLQQLLETVSLRNSIVDSMEEDRIRYIEEDQEIAEIIAQKNFSVKTAPPDEKVNKKKVKEEKKKKDKEMKQKEKELKKDKGKKKKVPTATLR